MSKSAALNGLHAKYTMLDLTNTAVHEAGHFLVAKHFGLSATIRLWRVEGNPEQQRLIWGQCAFDKTTPFRKSCIGWGGHVSDILRGIKDDITVQDLADEALHSWDEDDASESDSESINSHPQRRRAVKLAATVLLANRNEVQNILNSAINALHVSGETDFQIDTPGTNP